LYLRCDYRCITSEMGQDGSCVEGLSKFGEANEPLRVANRSLGGASMESIFSAPRVKYNRYLRTLLKNGQGST
jgi:hypothetical protein